MNSLVFFGSPNKNGNSATLAKELISHLHGEVRSIFAYESDIKPCTDCKHCYRKPGCSIKNDDMNAIYRGIEEADNIIISSPMHFGTISAQLLLIFSRLQTYWAARHVREEKSIMKKKNGVFLITSGQGWPNMMSIPEGTVRFAFEYMETSQIGSVYVSGTDKKNINEFEKAKTDAKYLAYRLNELSGEKLK